MTELKPCPFCGGKAHTLKNNAGHYAYCTKCLNGTSYYGTRELAIKAWNTRPDSWHTGTPTEEGCFYALQCKGHTHPEPYHGVVVDGKFSAISWDGDLMPLPPDLIAWQKIEPYKETD